MSTLKVGTIQDHANSITAISIDSSGRVTQPVKPAWSVEGITGTLSDGSVLNWTNSSNGTDTFSFVQGGVIWSGASDYKITVPVTGIYMVNVGVNMRSTSSSHAVSIKVVKNGTTIESSSTGKEDGESNHFDKYAINLVLNLSATDYLQVKNVAGQNIQFPNDADTGGYFNGYLIG